MSRTRQMPSNLAAFTALPARLVSVGTGSARLAVHISGERVSNRIPVICLADYIGNMSSFTEFAPLLQQSIGLDWPVVMVDLQGRGRATDRPRADDYSTTNDASDVSDLARALGIETAIFVGLGHGGQVIMALAATRPTLIAGTVLVDAGPVAATQHLVRLRSNAEVIARMRGVGGVTVMLRKMLSADYPDLDAEELDRLVLRTRYIDAKGQARNLFDTALIDRLRDFAPDDVLVPQWQMFDLLRPAPLLLLRSELTDQLPREIVQQMLQRRPDAQAVTIAGQGSPALLDHADEVDVIGDFVRLIAHPRERVPKRAPAPAR